MEQKKEQSTENKRNNFFVAANPKPNYFTFFIKLFASSKIKINEQSLVFNIFEVLWFHMYFTFVYT